MYLSKMGLGLWCDCYIIHDILMYMILMMVLQPSSVLVQV